MDRCLRSSFLLELGLVNLFIIALTVFFYFAVLRFFDGEKLKDFINYVQIGLTIAMTVGYHIVMRSFEIVNFDAVLVIKWWHFLLPPMWFAAPYELVLSGSDNQDYRLFSLLAMIVPIVAILIYIKLMRSFEKNLQKLAAHEDSSRRRPGKRRFPLSKLICYTKEERTFFEFAGLMMRRERDFKLKVYPALGFSIVFPFIFIFNDLRDQSLHEIAQGASYLSIYTSMIMIPTVVLMLQYSGKFKGAWIYKAVPLKDPSPMYKGTLKAFFVKLYFPLYVILSAAYLFIYGSRVFLSLVIVFIASILYALITFKALNQSLPFSMPIDKANESMGWRIFFIFIPIGVFVAIHALAAKSIYGLLIYFVIILAMTVVLWKRILNAGWDAIN